MAKSIISKVHVKEEMKNFSCNENVLFAWICSVRCLPFLEWNATFDYWSESERQKILISVLTAIDAIAFAAYNDAQAIADYASVDVYNAIASFKKCDDFIIYNTIHTIAKASAYVANIGEHTISEVVGNSIYWFSINHGSIIPQDLDAIKAGKQTFYADISIYGDTWDNFQIALRKLDCDYWADWYTNLFNKGLALDEKSRDEIQLRLNAPYSIVAQGATSISKYIKMKLPMNEEEFTRQYVIPALSSLGMFNIRYTHGIEEYGRDIVYQYKDNFGISRYGSAQVKINDISGRANGKMKEILEQIDDSFSVKYKDVAAMKEVRINQVVIICSGKYTNNAQEKILQKIQSGRNIIFLDGQDIANHSTLKK